MIAFGTAILDPDAYLAYAEPGIERAKEADSAVLAFAAVGSVARSYNLLLDTAARFDELEALAIVHPHAEIADPGFCSKVRRELSDEDVGVVGCVGATGVSTIAWWEGSVAAGPVTHSYVEKGGGEMPGYTWANPDASLGEVETVAGFLLVLAPWTVRNLRFDESLKLNYGYDVDYCRRVRDAGRKVVAGDFRMTYHHSLDLIDDLELWIEAHIQMAEKWDRTVLDEDGWRHRARRAEAEREAARAVSYSNRLIAEALVNQRERELNEATDSLSWRVTAPLRRINRRRAERS
jgi:hypothetical protein